MKVDVIANLEVWINVFSYAGDESNHVAIIAGVVVPVLALFTVIIGIVICICCKKIFSDKGRKKNDTAASTPKVGESSIWHWVHLCVYLCTKTCRIV